MAIVFTSSFIYAPPQVVHASAPTYFGSASNPADNGAQSDASTVAVTPPGSMVAGDLVVLIGQLQDSDPLGQITLSATGGQSWSAVSEYGGNDQTLSVYWAQYNGTWSADPSLLFATIGGAQPSTVVMHVFRPATVGTWGLDTAFAGGDEASAATVTVTGITPNKRDNVTLAGWAIPNASTWGTLSGTGWNAITPAQYRNTDGSDQSSIFAYQLQATPAATNNVSQNPSTAAAGISFTMAWSAQVSPTVALNTPADASSGSDTTPTLNFTGTDANSDALEYQVEITSPTEGGASWYDVAWSFRKIITIDHTKVPNTDQTDFPVLINISDDSSLAANARSDGYDILFTDSTGTIKIPYEREKFDEVTGELIAWVKVATLSYTTDTVLYMYYGKTSTVDQQEATSVWDANYVGVWHLADNAANTNVVDSTGVNNGTATANTSTKTVNGTVGNALDFNGSSDKINMSTTGFPTGSGAPWSLEAWAKTDVVDSVAHIHVGFGNAAAGASPAGLVFADNKWAVTSWGAGNNLNGSDAVAGVWKHFVGTGSSDNIRLYLNGQLDVGPLVVANSPVPTRARIGASSNSTAINFWDGFIDEVRISDIARSDDWIVTEYNNQSSPSTFYSISLNAFSATDTGFTAGHPFASGVAKDFTVQAGDALTSGTYYWKVRGIDPLGSNIYGSWSSTRSFIITGGSAHRVIRLTGKVKFLRAVKIY